MFVFTSPMLMFWSATSAAWAAVGLQIRTERLSCFQHGVMVLRSRRPHSRARSAAGSTATAATLRATSGWSAARSLASSARAVRTRPSTRTTSRCTWPLFTGNKVVKPSRFLALLVLARRQPLSHIPPPLPGLNLPARPWFGRRIPGSSTRRSSCHCDGSAMALC